MDYKKHYGLKEAPFRLSPDPDFFFPSDTHREALETLLYSIRAGEGFVQITGQPGTGKSMLLRKILQDIGKTVIVGLILHSNIQAHALLKILMQDLKIDISQVNPPSRENLIPLFRDFLMAQAKAGNQVIIIVDEAQNLPDETLEELRMLSNLETEKAKLLQIILVGQLELEQRITPSRLSQLAQRITIRYRLKPLTQEETHSYIFHRLEIAAIDKEVISVFFQAGVMGAIHKYTRGIPRLINIVCERSLMAAYIQGGSGISKSHLKKAILSIEGEPAPAKARGNLFFKPLTCALFVIFLLLIAGVWGYLRFNPNLPSHLQAKLESGLASKPESEPQEPPRMQATSTGFIPRDTPKTVPPVATESQFQPSSPSPSEQTFEQPSESLQPLSATNELALAQQWISLPQGVEQAGLINIEKGVLVMVKKKNGQLFSMGDMPIDWPLPQGIYMAGYSKQKERFIFHPELSYIKKIEINNPKFWQMVRPGKKNPITPLIAVDSMPILNKGPEHSTDTVQRVIMDWAATWRSMDLEKIMSYFSNVTSIYDVDKDQPLVFLKTRMYTIKKAILEDSGFIQLGLSDPICIINPLDPNLAYAVFHQTYKSRPYQDRGTKVLYFRRVYSSSTQSDWKITGKLWILDADFKTASSIQ